MRRVRIQSKLVFLGYQKSWQVRMYRFVGKRRRSIWVRQVAPYNSYAFKPWAVGWPAAGDE